MVNELKERLLLWRDFEFPELVEREIRIPETIKQNLLIKFCIALLHA